MDANSLLHALNQAISEDCWVQIHGYGCSAFLVKPTSADIRMDLVVVEGQLSGSRLPTESPSTKDLQSGEAMKERLRTSNERKVTLFLDHNDIKAVLIYHR